jgi:hypothetical protein
MKTLLVIGNDYDYKTLFEDVQHLTLKTERGKIQEEFHTVQVHCLESNIPILKSEFSWHGIKLESMQKTEKFSFVSHHQNN